jgi:hypothetical protein
MADFQINAELGSNNKNFATAPSEISFKTASVGCTLAFSPATSNCFGNVATLVLNKNEEQKLSVVAAVDTTFSTGSPTADGPYDITFGDDDGYPGKK